MKPSAHGKIERRILINFAADPNVVEPLIPEGYELHIVNSKAVVGICLIRLAQMRPKFVPAFFGIHSENIAHRIALRYAHEDGTENAGVFVPIRHTNSWITSNIGSRFFTGVYDPATFKVREQNGIYDIEARSRDGEMRIAIEAHDAEEFTSNLFGSLEEVSSFFECGSVGFSPDRGGCEIEGVKMTAQGWNMQPLEVHKVESSFYDNEEVFPKGSVAFDCALIMKDLPVLWSPVR
jgi:hypothetical protein